jgi:hypothetical protein
MEPDDPGGSAALRWPEPEPPPGADNGPRDGAEAAVGALYRVQAVGLIRLAYLMLGDLAAAEDVVQDAFCGLYRHRNRLADPGGARGAIITPDGRTVLGIESLSRIGRNAPVREHLVSWSTVTGRQTAVLNDLDALKRSEFEQILYTNADGSFLVLTYLRPGTNATIVHGGRSTPIPWSPHISVAAW